MGLRLGNIAQGSSAFCEHVDLSPSPTEPYVNRLSVAGKCAPVSQPWGSGHRAAGACWLANLGSLRDPLSKIKEQLAR